MSTTGRSKATVSSTTAIMAYKHQSTKAIMAYEHHSYSGSSGHHSSCAKELSKPKKPEKPKEVTLKVNCTCNKCLSSIIKALNSLKGVDSVEIGANREMVKIRGSATEEECIKEIKKLGKAVQKWPKDEKKGTSSSVRSSSDTHQICPSNSSIQRSEMMPYQQGGRKPEVKKTDIVYQESIRIRKEVREYEYRKIIRQK